jgi:hypothetical protein
LDVVTAAGLDPAVHVFTQRYWSKKMWTAGSGPAETIERTIPIGRIVL